MTLRSCLLRQFAKARVPLSALSFFALKKQKKDAAAIGAKIKKHTKVQP